MERIGYFNGQIGDLDTMQIPLCDRSVFYGDAVYDAILVLDRKPFTLDLHLDRLYRSCQLTQIAFTMPRAELEAEIARLLEVSPMGQTMLYIQVTRGAAPRKHEFPANAKPNLIMFVSCIKVPDKQKRATLASMEDLRFQYCHIKTTNLMPNVFAAQKATSQGATEALMHRGERVTEAAHSSILMLKDGVLVVPPLDELILPGITRAHILEICARKGIPVIEEPFTLDEMMDADEIFFSSASAVTSRVCAIDGKNVGMKDEKTFAIIRDTSQEDVKKECAGV